MTLGPELLSDGAYVDAEIDALSGSPAGEDPPGIGPIQDGTPGDWADRILEMLELGPGWDSYGSARIAEPAVSRAVEFATYLRDAGCGSIAPEVYPTSHGGVQLEWCHHDDLVEVRFSPGGPVDSVLIDLDGEAQMLEADDTDPSALVQALEVAVQIVQSW